jgi:hypothetical protein
MQADLCYQAGFAGLMLQTGAAGFVSSGWLRRINAVNQCSRNKVLSTGKRPFHSCGRERNLQ